jgi:hypothetical protein
MWSACVGVCQLKNWKMHVDTLKFGMIVFNTQRKFHSIPSDGLINWFYFFSEICEIWRKKSAHKCQVLTLLWGTTFQSAVSQQYYVSFSSFIFHRRYPSVFFQSKSWKNIADFWNVTPSNEWIFCVVERFGKPSSKEQDNIKRKISDQNVRN